MTNVKVLGETTVSMLKGRDGYQVKELNRLVNWLNKKENRPDVVYLSNVLLAGLAKSLNQTVDVPVVCMLQDEEKFLDDLVEPYNQQAWSALADCVNEFTAFIAIDENYANVMKDRLKIAEDKMHAVYAGKMETEEGVGCNIDVAQKIASMFTKVSKNFIGDDHA